MPTVSVVIPTYNREKYVTKAIDSVLVQTFKVSEVIVIDDGSADDTKAVLEPYLDKIRYRYQDNAGVSAARNAGIAQAKGEWVAFLDSDDEWMPDYVAAQIAHIRKYPEAVAHITNSVSLFCNGKEPAEHFNEILLVGQFGQEQSLLFDKPFSEIVKRPHWFLQATIMRRDALLATGLFNPQLCIGEDMDILARIALKGPISVNKDILVRIIRRCENIEPLSSKWKQQGIYSRQTFGKIFTELLKLPDLTLREKLALEHVLGEIWRALGNVLLKTGKKKEARLYYWKSLVLCPSLKSLIRFLTGFLPSKIAIILVRKGRDIAPGDVIF